jgi:hypothetical protein
MIEDPRAKHNKSRNPRKDRSLLRLMILGFILKARSENAGPLQRIISYCLVSQSVKKEVITSFILLMSLLHNFIVDIIIF